MTSQPAQKKQYRSRFAARKRVADKASSGQLNDHCFRHDAPTPFVSIRPQFDSKKGNVACLVFRPWPYVDPDDGEFYPCRVGESPDQIADFMVPAMHVVCGTDEDRVSFHTSLCEESIESEPDPYSILWHRLNKLSQRTKTNRPAWLSQLFPPKQDGDGYTPKLLPKPAQVMYVQGSVVMSGREGEMYDGSPRRGPLGDLPDDPVPVIRLSQNTADRLLNILAEKKPASLTAGMAPDDFEGRLMFGDPVHPDHGRFIYVWNAKAYTLPLPEKYLDLQHISKLLGVSNDSFSRYNVLPLKAAFVPGRVGAARLRPEMSPEVRELVRQKFIQWESLLRVPDNEEICCLTAKALVGFGPAFEYGWGDQREFYNYAKPYLRARTTSVPGAADAADHEAGVTDASDEILEEQEAWASAALGGGAPSEESGWSDDGGDEGIVTPDGEAYGEDAEAEAPAEPDGEPFDADDQGEAGLPDEDIGLDTLEEPSVEELADVGDDTAGDAEFDGQTAADYEEPAPNPTPKPAPKPTAAATKTETRPAERPSAPTSRQGETAAQPARGNVRPQPTAAPRPAQNTDQAVQQESQMAKKPTGTKPAPKSTKSSSGKSAAGGKGGKGGK